MADIPRIGPIRVDAGRELLFEPATKVWVPIRSGPPPRVAIAPSAKEISAMRRSRLGNTRFAETGPPAPGGLGGGVSFLPGTLTYRTATAISFRLAVPQDLGSAPTADLLYMTSSNCASKGCEALVSYFRDRQYAAAFMIWDWAHPPMPDGSQFVLTIPYTGLQPYLIPMSVPSPSGPISFDVLQIFNSTRVDGPTWTNEVFLYHRASGERERLWQYSFAWPTKGADPDYWWGPIFETFPDDAQYATAPILGFTDAVVLQDQIVRNLNNLDSQLSEPTSHGLETLWEQSNSGLISRGSGRGKSKK